MRRSCVPHRRHNRSTNTTARVPSPSFQCRRSCPSLPFLFCPASPVLNSPTTTIELCWCWCFFWRFGGEACSVLCLYKVIWIITNS
ncbi:hypothetical protein AHAS_Ahas16G0193700 [Arachis hypogaea]